ncbi:MAG: response regulator [Bacteroidales bacterium]|nr:response regulator [Bacteroidales bacterium]
MQPPKQHTIFLIEDNRTENILLKLSLNSFKNIKVHTYTNGKELLNNLNLNPDIIIVDLNLPDIQGYELIKMIKDYNSGIYIVVVSSQKDIEMIAKTQELGIFSYLVKNEGCLKHLKNVIQDILILIDYKENKQNTEE